MGWISEEIRYDCIYYRGDKPCKFRVNCPYCIHYHPMGYRILIFKLGAMGDVLRTTSILPSIVAGLSKRINTHHVTWIVDPPSKPLLENNPYINRIWTINEETKIRLHTEKFAVAYCFDKDPRSTGLMAICQAELKKGFIMGPEGNLHIANEKSEDALLLGISDMFKFQRSKKTYQQVIHEIAELESAGALYVFQLTDDEKAEAQSHLAQLGARKRPLIGLNTGAGTEFPGKRWPAEKFAELGKQLKESTGGTIVLLGGPQEVERNAMIRKELGGGCIDLGTDNPLRHFAAMVGQLDLIVTGDTMAMHVALACKVPVVALFGPTPAHEVDLGGLGEKLWREQLGDKRMGGVPEELSAIRDIEVDEVEAACKRILG